MLLIVVCFLVSVWFVICDLPIAWFVVLKLFAVGDCFSRLVLLSLFCLLIGWLLVHLKFAVLLMWLWTVAYIR